MTHALEVDSLIKDYGGRRVLDGVSLTVRPGELVAVLGANGSGKSTTLKCAAGLEKPDGGSIRLVEAAGTEASPAVSSGASPAVSRATAAQHTAMIFQRIHLVPRRTALENVCAGALARAGGPASVSPLFFSGRLKAEAMDCLDRVGMAAAAHDRAGRLSGGQQQRVAVARALCQRASVLLADEPVSALDPHAAEQVMTLLADLAHRENLAVAAVLHQPDLAARHADRALGLLHGRMVFDDTVAAMTDDVRETLYTTDQEAA